MKEEVGRLSDLFSTNSLLKSGHMKVFFFAMSGAVYSRLVVGDEAKEFFGPISPIILIVVSRCFRPANRKIITIN